MNNTKSTQCRTVMIHDNLQKSSYTCPNGNVLTFRGGDSAKVMMALRVVEALGLTKFELRTLSELLDNFQG